MWVQLEAYEHYLETALGCHQVFAFEDISKSLAVAARLLDLTVE